MSCNTCDKAFTLLCREKGCPNCGFSYCAGCLKYKQNVDKLKKTVKVCAPCNRTLSNPKVEGAKPRSPPSALRKRMERLNSLPDTKHPITVYREGQITQLKRGLSTEDQHLADRLQQLKEPVGVTETDDEMQERLARLRGIDPAKASTASNSAIKPQPPKPDVLRAEELLEEIGAEIEIDEKMPDPDDEIAQRLAKLKGVDVDQVKNPGRKMSQNREESKTSDVDPESFLHDHSTYSATSKSSHLDNDTSENDVDPSVLVRELTKENTATGVKRKCVDNPEDILKTLSQAKSTKKKHISTAITPYTPPNFIGPTIPIKQPARNKIILKTKEGGKLSIHPHKLECKLCHYPFQGKTVVLEHTERKVCETAACGWMRKKQVSGAHDHQHQMINEAFLTRDKAMTFLKDACQVDDLYRHDRRMKHQNVAEHTGHN